MILIILWVIYKVKDVIANIGNIFIKKRIKTLTFRNVDDNITLTIELSLQGRVNFPTGGIAHEPQGMIR